jgi:hypothetical protein
MATPEEQLAAIRAPDFVDALRAKLAAVAGAFREHEVMAPTFDTVVNGARVSVVWGDTDARVTAGPGQGTTEGAYVWRFPVAWVLEAPTTGG